MCVRESVSVFERVCANEYVCGITIATIIIIIIIIVPLCVRMSVHECPMCNIII